MFKKLLLSLLLLNISNTISFHYDYDEDVVIDDFYIEDENLVTCLCCSNLATFIFFDENEIMGLCLGCFCGC
jgi:hypothetical protein